MQRTIPDPPAIARRTRPPPHWKFAVSVRKRWQRLRRLWRPDREIEEISHFDATFRISPNGLIGREMVSALSAVVPSYQDSYEVDVVPLDERFSFTGKPLILKVDVEGYELEVLEGAKAVLAQNYGYAQIESFEKQRADAVIDFMARHGWQQSDHIVDDLVFRRPAV